jgi:hypothetical protein
MFVFMFAACSYVAFKSWAGVRYYSMFLPFVYASGISYIYSLSDTLLKRWGFRFKDILLTSLVTGVLLLPVYYPHRYFIRRYHKIDATIQNQIDRHVSTLDSLLTRETVYCAVSLGKVNYLTGFNCFGIQRYYDSSHVEKTIQIFNPGWIVLTQEEAEREWMKSILREFRRRKKDIHLELSRNGIHYYRLVDRRGHLRDSCRQSPRQEDLPPEQ